MSYGDGSITEIKKPNGSSYTPKRWRIALSYMYPVPQEDGTVKNERKRIQKRFTGTKAEAKAMRDKLAAEHDSNGNLRPEIERQVEEQKQVDAMTLTKLIELWDAVRKTAGTASERTLKENRNSLKHVERHLGDTPIEQINAQMIEMAYAAIREERNLSGTTMNHIHVLLKNVFQKAIDYDMLYKNPCAYVVAPKRNKSKRNSLNTSEGARLLRQVNESEEAEYAAIEDKESRRRYREDHGIARERNAFRGLHHLSCIMAIRIGLATGMRRGEVFGLTWEHVNLKRNVINVCQSATNKRVYKETKTDAGTRVLAIDGVTAAHLQRWKSFQADYLAEIGIEQSGSTPVCCSDTGSLYGVDNFEHWWREWRNANGFPKLKFHELRHTQATQLLANGVDVKTVADRLGHANPSITLSWYAHAIPEKDHEAAAIIGNLFADTNSFLQTDTTDFSLSPAEAYGKSPAETSFSNVSKMSPASQSLPEKQTGQLLEKVS